MALAKYFDGRTPVSHLVDIAVEGSVLRINRDGQTIGRWPLRAIFRDPTHTVVVMIGCAAGEDRLEVSDADTLSKLNFDTRSWVKRDLTHVKWAVPSLILVLLLIGFGLWHSRTLTRYLASKVTVDQERKLKSLIELEGRKELCSLTPPQEKALGRVLDRLFSGDPENAPSVQVSFMKSDVKNAFALPGGGIWIFRGLLQEMTTPEELAGILAHEIEHVHRRHVVEAMIRAALLTGLLNLAAGDVSGFILIDPATASQIFGLKLSREMEEEADRGAIERLKRSGIGSGGITDFFARIAAKEPSLKYLGFLSTHPDSDGRAKMFQRELPFTTELPILTDDEWRSLRAACTGQN